MDTLFARALRFALCVVALLLLITAAPQGLGLAASAVAIQAPADPLPDPITVEGRVLSIDGSPLEGVVVQAQPASYVKLFMPAIVRATQRSAQAAGDLARQDVPDPAAVASRTFDTVSVYTTTTDGTGRYQFVLPGAAYLVSVDAVDSKPPLPLLGFFAPRVHLVDQGPQDDKPPIPMFINLSTDPLDEKIWIQGSAFSMGCAPGDGACAADEQPLHTVFVDDYEIDKYAVTNARYAACVAAGTCTAPVRSDSATRPSYFDNPVFAKFPVTWVTYPQARTFCRWEGSDLPTEAMWEKAARGAGEARLYPWGSQAPDCMLANYHATGAAVTCQGDTAAVNTLPDGRSPYGLLNMAGNVQEWIKDWYAGDTYGSAPAVNPTGPASGTERVLRGGSWDLAGTFLRISARQHAGEDTASNSIGFRCARRIRFSIAGRVNNGNAGVAGVTISNGVGASVQTRADGSFVMSGLLPGTYMLSASMTGTSFVPAVQSVYLGYDAREVNFEQRHQISGKVTVGGTVALAGVRIQTDRGDVTFTGGDGTYLLGNLLPGTYVVSADHANYLFEPPQVTLTLTSNRADIDFAAVPAHTLVGTVLTSDASATPLKGVTVSDGKGHSTITADDGTYALRLPQGTHTITASQREMVFTPASAELSVPATLQQDFRGAFADMVYVPQGSFRMGHDGGDYAQPAAQPQHSVILSSFYMDKYEVTNARYAVCVADGGCSPPSSAASRTRASYYGNAAYDGYPVINVSWTQANAFCAWAGKRLPTEAEWEKAARGADARLYPWGNSAPQACTQANYNDCSGDTSAVGSYPAGASPYGIADLAGNVREFVADWLDAGYYQKSTEVNPLGPAGGERRVIRGGDYGAGTLTAATAALRTYWRDQENAPFSPGQLSTGFRCVYGGATDYVADGWQARTVPSSFDWDTPAASSSLAFDSNNRPRIAFLDASKLPKLAVFNGSAAESSTVFAVDGAWQADAIQLFLGTGDTTDLYYETSNGWHVGHWNGSTWSLEDTGFPNGIWLQDGTGRMHIVYCAGNALTYAYRDGTSWVPTTLETGMTVCTAKPYVYDYAMAAALDANGYAHIVYQYALDRKFRYRYQDAGGWHMEDVAHNDGGPWFSALSLKTDAGGRPHLSYYNGTYLFYATRTGGAWQFTAIDTEQKLVGWETSLVLDSSGRPRISYYAYGGDPLLDQLRYAWYDGAAWQKTILYAPANGGFPMDGGRNSSLALDGNNKAGISFLTKKPGASTGVLHYIFQWP